MSVIVELCASVACLSLVCLLVFHRGSRHLDRAGVAGLGAVANLVSAVVCLLAAAGYAGQELFDPTVSGRRALQVAAGCFGAQLICMLRLRMVTKPRRVPRRVEGWRLPACASRAVTLLVSDVCEDDGRVAVEVVNRAGRLAQLPTSLDAPTCRALVGHQVVAIVTDGDTPQLLDLIDLGGCADSPVIVTPEPSSVARSPLAPTRPLPGAA